MLRIFATFSIFKYLHLFLFQTFYNFSDASRCKSMLAIELRPKKGDTLGLFQLATTLTFVNTRNNKDFWTFSSKKKIINPAKNTKNTIFEKF